MKIAIIGAGNIGANLATQFSKAGHQVLISFSRDEEKLRQRAMTMGYDVQASSVAEAVSKSEVVVLACLWSDIDNALAEAGNLEGKIIIDATNQYGADGLIELPTSVVEYNQARMPGAKLIRAFNTLTADFQREVAQGKHRPVAMFYAAQDESVKRVAEALIRDAGFIPVYSGGWGTVGLIEAPEGIVLGRVYAPEEGARIANAILQGNIKQARHLADTFTR